MRATLNIPWNRLSCARAIWRCIVPPALAAAALVPRAHAQHVGFAPLVTLTSEADERIRVSQLIGASNPAGYLLRSPSRLSPLADSTSSWKVGLLIPELRTVHNSGIPFSPNDGSLWAGRGWNQQFTGGLFLQIGPARLIAAPTYVVEDNAAFQVIPYPQTGKKPRSVWANPFHPLPESIDLPLRFGDQRRHRLDAGQSSVTIDLGLVSLGAGTENRWWGPGALNAITLSNNAPGFPHAFLQAARPIRTPLGTFDAQWILGQLSESRFFDQDTTNDKRSLNGLALTWTPPGDSALTIGLARLVMTAQSDRAIPFGAAFDVFRTVGHTNVDTATPPPIPGRDQISTLFARYVLPGAGFEAYAEWARFEEPRSLRDLLESPGHSQAYTLGLQWAHPFASGRTARVQTEATYLEPDASLRLRPVATTYTSRGVPQGFTERGQTIGAAIGPSGSSQALASDLFARHWRLGTYLGRIRWDNGTLFEPIVPQFKREDVSLFAGVRGSVSFGGVNLLVDFAHGARFNYLYQTYVTTGENTAGIDLINNTLSVSLSSAVGRR